MRCLPQTEVCDLRNPSPRLLRLFTFPAINAGVNKLSLSSCFTSGTPRQIRPCFMGGYIPEERLESRHAGKFGLKGALRDDRDDIDDIFGNGIFIVLNVTIVTLGCIVDT